MKIRKLGERELIAAISAAFGGKAAGVVLGIGDDAAVLEPGSAPLILTKDLLVENIDFIKVLHPPFLLGRKSLSVNLSDIAAMGGRPRFALLGLGFPPATEAAWVREFLRGFKSAADEQGARLVGGDLSSSREIVISVTVIGEGRVFVRRAGGKPGDLLYVSGTLGDAQAGFRLLKKGWRAGKNKAADLLLRAFLDPAPHIRLGRELAQRRLASSMIDISDGLSVDLMHLCEAGGTGAEIDRGKIPLSPALRALIPNPWPLALHGGEDFQLLFSAPPSKKPDILKLAKKFPVTEIGRLTKKRMIYLVSDKGKKTLLQPRGYEHFKSG